MTGNAVRMQKVDDSWNDHDWDAFDSLHDPDCTVYWPGRESAPTQGASGHRAEAIAFCAAFPDNRVHNQPYDIQFGEGDLTTFVPRFSGTFTAPLALADGTFVQPTDHSFNVLYSTTARWREGRIPEEYLFYDNATFMQQVGLS